MTSSDLSLRFRWMSWENSWQEGRTGWDAGASPPSLVELVRGGTLPGGLAVVPGCGAGYDVLTLANDGRRVVGIDVAPTAGKRFDALRDEAGIDPAAARVHVGDFFSFDPGEEVHIFWDYTFFCAIPPDMRSDWAARVDALLADDGELITLIFPTVNFGPPDGPPYKVDLDLYRAALGDRFEPSHIDETPPSHEGRAGKEFLVRWKRA